MIPASAIMLPVFGDPSAKFEAAKFTWLGSMNKEAASCGIWHTAGVENFDEMFQKEVIFGASGAGGITVQHAMVLKNLLGTKAKIISGYQGTKDVNMAMMRGEVHASCGLFVSTLQTQWRDDWRDGRLKILIQLGSENHPAYKDAPNIFNYAKSDEDRQVLQLIFGQLDLGRPLLGPPGVPAAQTEVLRTALIATLKDPQFLAEAEKAQMEISPATAAEVDKLLAEFTSFPPSVVAKAKHAMGE
jgi:tripartite-type tricarboxylate transporter receptor subunit TctC